VVERLIRICTSGSMRDEVKLRDIVLAMSASTDSAVNQVRFRGMDYAPTASFALLKAAWDCAMDRKLQVVAGPVLSSDMFYTEDPEQWRLWAKFGVLAVEMETAELYTLAAKYGCEALSILTVSDHLVTGEATTAEQRQLSFSTMMEIALETALFKYS
jgi:purine-nucleoside phosphorylase